MLVACSGGSDSVGLAALCSALSERRDLRLTLGHVNHGVRRSAWQDEAVVARISAALNVPLAVAALQPEGTDEATLRDARYEALTGLALRAGASVVATGHTAEDQTETVLLALFRGSGAAGLTGMRSRRVLAGEIELARPLLPFPRAAVRAYVQHAGLPYAVDPTNADLGFRRNAVREALAALRPLFPGLDEAVSRAAALIAAERACAPEAALRDRVREVLNRQEALGGVTFGHIEAAVRALERGRSGRFAMGPRAEVAIERGALSVHRKQ